MGLEYEVSSGAGYVTLEAPGEGCLRDPRLAPSVVKPHLEQVIDSGLVCSTDSYSPHPQRHYWEGCRERRRCSRVTYSESYITKYTSVRRKSWNNHTEKWRALTCIIDGLSWGAGYVALEAPGEGCRRDLLHSLKHIWNRQNLGTNTQKNRGPELA